MILPSLLEYSSYDINKRIEQITELLHENKLQSLIQTSESDSFDALNVHLDFVLPQFAKDRSPILASSGYDTIFTNLKSNFKNTKLNLSVHLMGELEDLNKAWQYFKNFKKPKNWSIVLFVPLNHAKAWKSEFKKYKIGAWIDLNFWNDKSLETKIKNNLEGVKNVLLMTVVAGKSGQKLELQTVEQLSDFIDHNMQIDYFVIDGGWSRDKAIIYQKKHQNKNRLDFVSYGAFWSEVEKLH